MMYKYIGLSRVFLIIIFLSIPSYFQIDNDFKNIHEKFIINKYGDARFTIHIDKIEPFQFELHFKVDGDDAINQEVSVELNGIKIKKLLINEVSSFRNEKFLVSQNSFKIGENDFVLKTSSNNQRVFFIEARAYNYVGISPNIPVAYVVPDERLNFVNSLQKYSVKVKHFAFIFLLFLLIYLLILSPLSFFFYRNALDGFCSAYRLAGPALFCFWSVLLYSFFSPYSIIYPVETLVWLTLFTFTGNILVVLAFGAKYPKIVEYFLPENKRGPDFLPSLLHKIFKSLEKAISYKFFYDTDIKRAMLVLFFFLPPAVILYLINKYGVLVPYWDEWALVPLLEHAKMGTLSISEFWQQHNEHRLFFPRLVMVGLALMTDWNIAYELYVSFITALLTLYFLCLLLKKTLPNVSFFFKLTILFSVIIFSPMQWKNWLWGWQLQIFMNVLAVVVCVWALSTYADSIKGFMIALLAAFVASFSFSNGLLVWFSSGILFFSGEWGKKYLFAWASAFFVTVGLYLQNFNLVAGHPSVAFFLEKPFVFIQYVLIYIGTPLGPNKDYALSAGIILILLIAFSSIYIYRKEKSSIVKILPWLAFALYVFMSAVVTGVGRAGFGVDQALSSRYISISNLFVISFVVINTFASRLLLKNNKREWKYLLIVLVSAFVVISLMQSFKRGVKKLKTFGISKQRVSVCLENIELTDDECLKKLFPDPNIVRIYGKRLIQLNFLKTFSWDSIAREKSDSMSIESFGKRNYESLDTDPLIIETNKKVTVSGWAIDKKSGNSGSKVYLILRSNGDELVIPTFRNNRDDIARRFGNQKYRPSGWSYRLRVAVLKGNCYFPSLRLLKNKEKEYYEWTGFKQVCFK